MLNWIRSFWRTFRDKSPTFCAFAALVIIVCIFFLGLATWAKPRVSEIFSQQYLFVETKNTITEKEQKSIELLIAKNKIVPVTLIYEDTMRYYDHIITLLVTLLGLFAFVSWLYIGGKVQSKMIKNIHDEIQSKWFDVCLEKKVKEYLNNQISDYLAEQSDDEKIRYIVKEELEKAQRLEGMVLDTTTDC